MLNFRRFLFLPKVLAIISIVGFISFPNYLNFPKNPTKMTDIGPGKPLNII